MAAELGSGGDKSCDPSNPREERQSPLPRPVILAMLIGTPINPLAAPRSACVTGQPTTDWGHVPAITSSDSDRATTHGRRNTMTSTKNRTRYLDADVHLNHRRQ